jgi:hypothetical protein
MIDVHTHRHPSEHRGCEWHRNRQPVYGHEYANKTPAEHVFGDVPASWAQPLDGYMALARAQEWGVVPKLLFGSDLPLGTSAQAAAEMPQIDTDTIDWLIDGDPREALGVAK